MPPPELTDYVTHAVKVIWEVLFWERGRLCVVLHRHKYSLGGATPKGRGAQKREVV